MGRETLSQIHQSTQLGRREYSFLFDGMKKLIMYDSKKAGAFNAFLNLTKKVSSDLEMRTANTWERRAKSQAESAKELVTDV